MHTLAAQARVVQRLPHVPQFEGSVRVSTSHPLAGLASQSARPAAQTMPQRPAVHVRVAPVPPGHTLPHEPQLSGLVCVSTQAMPQRA